MEEALGFWWEDVDGCRSCSGVLAHQGDVFRVPTEDGDVFLDPLEGQDLILQPEVAGGGPVLGGKEPQGAQPVVHSNQHHVVVQEVLGSEGWLSVATCGEKFEKLSGIKWTFLWYTFFMDSDFRAELYSRKNSISCLMIESHVKWFHETGGNS